MSLPQKVVLLCCGSFNPITNMHLRMFELARDSLDATGRYKVVGGIISPVNDAYTKPSLVSAKHRSAMIRLALQTSEWIKVDTWESEQEEWLETIKVLKHHRESIESTFNANPPPDTPTKKRKLDGNMSPADFSTSAFNLNEGMPHLKLLCGADLLSSFAQPGLWKDQDIEDIVGKYGIVCITRANSVNPENFIYESDALSLHRMVQKPAFKTGRLLSYFQENIHIVTEWIHNEISSTKIRRALKRSKSIKYLVQDPVIEYIKVNGLYTRSTLDNCSRRSPSPFNDHDHRDIRRLQHQPYSYQDNHDAITTARCLTTEPELRQALRSQSLDAEAKPRCHRRHLNLDEEQRRHRSSEECHETKHTYRKTFSFDSIEANGRVRHASGGPSRENSLDSMDYNKKRLGYRRQDSVESGESQRPPLYKQADSIDSVNSERSSTIRSPHSPSPAVTCMGMADISGLMRRVRGMRVAVTPETCV